MNVLEIQGGLRNHLYILNQVYALKRRLRLCQIPDGALRPLERIEEHLAANLHVPALLPDGWGLVIEDPSGQRYDDRRTDLEAEVIGDSAAPLYIVDVIKPVIRLTSEGRTLVIQRGSVTVAPRKTEGEAS